MKKIMMAFTAVLVSSVVGCASPGLSNGYNVQIDSAFSDNEVSIIEAGITSWSALSSSAPDFSFTVTPTFSLPQEKDVGWTEIVVRKSSIADIRAMMGGDAIGVTNISDELDEAETGNFNMAHKAIGATSYLPGLDELSKQLLFLTAAHETGHAMGLSHTLNAGDVMNPTPANNAGKPTCDDLARYCDLRKITCSCDE